MELELDLVIDTPNFSVDMKSGLTTMQGVSDAVRLIAETVATDEVPSKNTSRSSVRTRLKKNFSGSYGQMFSVEAFEDEAIKRLDLFCNEINTKSISESFRNLTQNQYLEIENFSNPYVCIRIPTGGGKTFIATKSIRILTNEYLNKDYSLVFWLAPSDKIVTQTLEALKDKRHFYRKVLDKEFDNINVLSIQESYKQKFDPTNELVIIVGTIQSFRTNNKDGRKFFDENSNYYEMLKLKDITPFYWQKFLLFLGLFLYRY